MTEAAYERYAEDIHRHLVTQYAPDVAVLGEWVKDPDELRTRLRGTEFAALLAAPQQCAGIMAALWKMPMSSAPPPTYTYLEDLTEDDFEMAYEHMLWAHDLAICGEDDADDEEL